MKPKILWLGRPFLGSYFAPHAEIVHVPNSDEAHLIEANADAQFAMCISSDADEYAWRRPLLAQCHRLSIPRCHWAIDDPNHLPYYRGAVRRTDFDFAFTTDRQCLLKYHAPVHPRLKALQALWLPLAAAPEYHKPLPLLDDPAQFVLVAQSYLHWPARRAAARELIRPLIDAHYSLRVFCPEGGWAEEPTIAAQRVGGECFTEHCGEHYRAEQIALGLNCQAGLGIDQYDNTAMTSMRTFEVLAMGRPLLAYQSAAYEALGFENGVHFRWVGSQAETLQAAAELLAGTGAAEMAARGRSFVLANHTYAHRLLRILSAIDGKVNARSWGLERR